MAYHVFYAYINDDADVRMLFLQSNTPTPAPSEAEYLIVRNSIVANQLNISPYLGQQELKSTTYRYAVGRCALQFYNSEVPSGASVEYISLDIAPTSIPVQAFDIVIQNGQPTYPHDPVVVGDYDKDHYAGDGGSLNTDLLVDDEYNSIPFNATGLTWATIGAIDSLIIKLCLRSSRDISALMPNYLNREYFLFLRAIQDLPPRLSIRVTLSIPTLTTQAVTDLQFFGAVFHGTITDTGWWIDDAGFEWKLGSTGEVHSVTAGINQDTTTFALGQSGLRDNPLDLSYYCRAWGSNAAGKGYGDWVTFDLPKMIAAPTYIHPISPILFPTKEE